MTADPYMATASGANNPADPQSWNRYAYAVNDPINRFDPSGLNAPMIEDMEGLGGGGRLGIFPAFIRDIRDPENTAIASTFAYVWFPANMRASAAFASGPNPFRAKEERDRAGVHDGIYEAAAKDPVFGPEVLDCIAGAETNWNIDATRGKEGTAFYRIGLYQFTSSSWKATGTSLDWEKGSDSAFLSTSVKIAGLYRSLAQVVSPATDPNQYTEAQIREAIRRNGNVKPR